MVIEGHKTLPAEILNANEDKFTITIYEGKKRQIRLMVASLNAKVVKLKRIQIGKLKLGNLELGKYKLLEDSSVNLLTKID